MAAPQPVLTLGDARRVVAEHGFQSPAPAPTPPTPAPAPAPATRLGVEIEWHTVHLDDPDRGVPFETLESAARAIHLPARSRLTFEPGGQVELSSRPLPGFDACRAIGIDAHALTAGLAPHGIGLVGIGLLPGAVRTRVLRSPRYDAMEAHFDVFGDAGRTMMRQTAAIQVNIDLDASLAAPSRWHAAHALGPLLAAVFANSPFDGKAPSGWSSTRLAVWLAIERGRSAPVGAAGGAGPAWADYALRAPVMCIRVTEDDFVPVCEPLTFAEWIVDGHELGWPTEDDLAYHLTTLFPPIRPRGWLELRMIDSLRSEWSTVPAIVAAALLEDADGPARIARHLGPLAGRWDDAARRGIHDPDFAAAAVACFDAARTRWRRRTRQTTSSTSSSATATGTSTRLAVLPTTCSTPGAPPAVCSPIRRRRAARSSEPVSEGRTDPGPRSTAALASGHPVPMAAGVVLVHGAWHGAWCFEPVLELLAAAGIDAVAVDLPGHGDDPGPLGDLHTDAARVEEALDRLDGDCVLLGHSYGGAVITEAGVHPSVRHLVYLAAFALDAGESVMAAAVAESDALDLSYEGPSLADAFVAHDDGTITLEPTGAAACLYHDCDAATTGWALARLGAQPTVTFGDVTDRGGLAGEAVDLRGVQRGPGGAPRAATGDGPEVRDDRRVADEPLPVPLGARTGRRPRRRSRPQHELWRDEAQVLVDLAGRGRAIQRVEVQPGRAAVDQRRARASSPPRCRRRTPRRDRRPPLRACRRASAGTPSPAAGTCA